MIGLIVSFVLVLALLVGGSALKRRQSR